MERLSTDQTLFPIFGMTLVAQNVHNSLLLYIAA